MGINYIRSYTQLLIIIQGKILLKESERTWAPRNILNECLDYSAFSYMRGSKRAVDFEAGFGDDKKVADWKLMLWSASLSHHHFCTKITYNMEMTFK
jgi:hypothetical protein